ncbi:MAG: DUF4199 domain-containing protein [Cyclobacteriaceae bacterium]|nr:DUF4199 domain-containing protein [Cyclobacteriaceae bacterium]
MDEQSIPAVTTRSVGMRYGGIMAIISIVVFVAMSFAKVDMSSGIGRWATIPFLLVLIFLAQKNFKDNGDSYMSYGQGMGITFWIALVSTVIYIIFFYVYIAYIDGSFIETIKQTQMDKMAEQGMPQEQIEQAMGYASLFMTPGIMAVFGFFGGIVGALLCGLVVTIFTQKNSSAG